MDRASCVILGCAKNIAAHLIKSIKSLDAIRSLWKECAVVIAENGSTDGTKAMLASYGKRPTTHILTLDAEANPIELRTERLAYIRNHMMDFVHAHPIYSTYDYILIVDLDGILDGFKPSDLDFAFKSSTPWDALFANSAGSYYDVWALRSKALGLQNDCWDLVRHLQQQGFEREVARTVCVKTYQAPLQFTGPFIEVQSAFGGLGLYRLAKTKECRYDGLTRACSCQAISPFKTPCTPQCCEHVAFHKDMIEKYGAKLFICKTIVIRPPAEHL